MDRPTQHIDLTSAETWMIEQLRTLGRESYSVTFRLDNGQPTHLYLERLTDNRRISELLDEADYQVLTIKKTKGRIRQIVQRIVRKRD